MRRSWRGKFSARAVGVRLTEAKQPKGVRELASNTLRRQRSELRRCRAQSPHGSPSQLSDWSLVGNLLPTRFFAAPTSLMSEAFSLVARHLLRLSFDDPRRRSGIAKDSFAVRFVLYFDECRVCSHELARVIWRGTLLCRSGDCSVKAPQV